jgi:ATP phosphoribosyltransferase
MSRAPAEPTLRLALPSKGMEEETLAFLRECGLRVNRVSLRQYRARIPAIKGVEVLFQRAGDIFDKVAEGSVDLGITGFDVVAEHNREDDPIAVLNSKLGFGACALVVAVPEGWIDVTSVADLAEISASQYARGRELRIATKYPNLTRQFMFDNGINYFALSEASGALEAAPALGTADIIVDLVSSGVTLRENRLKQVAAGTIVESQACLIGNRAALLASVDKLEATRQVMELIEAHLRSREFFSVTANIRGDSPESVARQIATHHDIAGLRGPTIAKVFPTGGGDEGWYAATVIVRSDRLMPAIDSLRRVGASNVSVVQLRYVFESRSWTFEAMRRALTGHSEVEE